MSFCTLHICLIVVLGGKVACHINPNNTSTQVIAHKQEVMQNATQNNARSIELFNLLQSKLEHIHILKQILKWKFEKAWTTRAPTRKTTTTEKDGTSTTETTISPPITCNKQNNLLLMIDSSGSIGKTDYETALEFAARLAVAWKGYPPNGIAMSVFSSHVEQVISFDKGATLSQEEIRKDILEAIYLGESTATHLALHAALIQLAQSTNNTSIPLNLVVLTDGVSDEPSETLNAATRVRAAGIRIFCVGVGSGVNQDELLQVAGNHSNRVFNINGFNDLLVSLRPLSQQICM